MKIVTVIGARPQFIKASVVSIQFVEQGVQEVIVHTGQHFDPHMSDVFFDELEIPHPSVNLGIGGGSHGQNTGRMIEAIERTLFAEKPDVVVVYGDTDSTLAGALAAVKIQVPVAHVEAGLRSFNRKMPEEINRVLTDHASTLLLTPTELAVQQLVAEGIEKSRIKLVGDVMFDAALHFGQKADKESVILSRLGLHGKGYVLATVHRAENTDDVRRLRAIIEGLAASKLPVVLPLHPRTRSRLALWNLTVPSRIRVIEPVGYLDMVMLEKNAVLIATDSGGVQKEAFFHRVPCVTLRDETEWRELVDAGWNSLAPPNEAAAVAESIQSSLEKRGADVEPYGNGNAAERIVECLQAGNLR